MATGHGTMDLQLSQGDVEPLKNKSSFLSKAGCYRNQEALIYTTKFQLFPVNHCLLRADLNSKASFTGMNTEMSGLKLQGGRWGGISYTGNSIPCISSV